MFPITVPEPRTVESEIVDPVETFIKAIDPSSLFTVTPESIADESPKYLAMTISGPTDLANIDAVKAARTEAVTARTTIEKQRKAAKEPFKKAGEEIDAHAKKLTALLAPVEKHLTDELTRIEREQAEEEKRKADELFAIRQRRLTEIGGQRDFTCNVRAMTEAQFESFLIGQAQANVRQKEDDERRRQQAEANRIEQEKLAAFRKKLDEERAELEAEKQKQFAIRQQLADEEARRQQQERQRQHEADLAEREEKQRLRREALRPDIDKVLAWAEECRKLQPPELSADSASTYERLKSLVTMFADEVARTAGRV